MESVGSMFGFFCCKVAISERKSIRNGTQKWCHPVAPQMWGKPRLLQCLFSSGCSSNLVAGTSAKQPRAGPCRPGQAEADKSSDKEPATRCAENEAGFIFFEPCRKNQVTISGYRKWPQVLADACPISGTRSGSTDTRIGTQFQVPNMVLVSGTRNLFSLARF